MSEVRAEISATVGQVRIAVGQRVAEGDELIVLETMTTEIPVLSPLAGRVVAVHVAPDSPVHEGDLVAVIE